MLLFNQNKLDPIIKLKFKEKAAKDIPAIITLRIPPSTRLKNSISKNRGKIKYEYPFIKAVAADLTLDGIDKLSELPEVMFISYDRKANVCMDRVQSCLGLDYKNPYALTGKGVNIAVIDTGAYPHGDLTRPYRVITYFKDFINSYDLPYDDNGHGTHLCGVIAGSGAMSDGRYRGIATGSRIVMLKAFDSVGAGSFSDILAAMAWIAENREKYNIKVLCLPFGTEAIVPYKADPLCIAAKSLWDAGIIVVSSSGNNGPHQETITTPGVEPSIITAGCCDCRDINIKNYKIPDFSGRGSKKDNTIKPELIAPGVNITSLACDKNYIPTGGRHNINVKSLVIPYAAMTGSSVSAAVAAGSIALILEKMPNISGKDLKDILKLSCHTLNESNTAQGHGVINLKELL